MAMANISSLQAGSTPHSVQTPEGITIKLITGSIIEETADVIVNITSQSLQLNGGTISKVILKAAGATIQNECDDKHQNGVKFGQFVETTGGNLNCKVIYHGCVSNWSHGAGEKVLCQLLQGILSSADTDGMTSIAFPAIGTGQLGFPKDKVAAILYDEFTKFSSTIGSTMLQEIHVVLHNNDTENIKAFEQHVAKLVRPKSSASASQKLPITITTSNGTIITVKENDVTDEKVDVLVNSTGGDMMLDNGALSRAVLKAAGDSIQEDCNNNKPASLSHGDIVMTGGGNLSVKAIYHGSLAPWSGGKGEQIMETFIYNCLDKANKDDMKSIALPALGTGVLKFPLDNGARIMNEAITRYCGTNPQAELKDIRIVVFDAKSVKAFQKYFGDLKGKEETQSAGQPPSPPTTHSSTQGAAAASFGSNHFRFFQRYHNTDETPVISTDITSFTTSEGLKVTLRKGQLTEEKADVLVNVVGKDLNLTNGAITSAIRRASGAGVEQECRTAAPNGLEYGDIISTSGGNITCEAIYHGAVPPWSSGQGEEMLRVLVRKILAKADADGYTSIATPSIGTGIILGYPADKVAECMIDEMKKYSSANIFSSIGDVKIVLFEKDTAAIKAFETYLQTTSSSSKVKQSTESPSLPDLPACWDAMNKDELYHLVCLSAASQEYKDVAKNFVATGGPDTIQKIERVQCPNGYQLYTVRRIQMDATITDKKRYPVERVLYHGTAQNSLDKINLIGFNRNYGGKNATMYGYGVYFAKNASYSVDTTYSPADKQRNRYVYQCQVLTGEYTIGRGDMKIPPPKNPILPDILFDSAVNNVRNPTVFVVFYDAQSYPQYLITFK